MTASGSDSPLTPAERDEALEPVDVSKTDHERLLFYLAARVPVSIQELAEDTKQSTDVLREYFYEELQNEVDIDSTDFTRLTDSARKPVIRASKSYIKSAQGQFDAGRSSIDQNLFTDAIDHFERAIRIFEQIRSRFEAVNYTSEKLEQRIEAARNFIEEAQDAIEESANRVEPLLDDNRTDADANVSHESSSSVSASDDREAMLEIVRELHKRLGRVPKTTELPEECDYSPNDFYKEFGSWDEALEAAGIDKEQELLDDIKRVAEKLGRTPEPTDMAEHGTYPATYYSTYFDSWSSALERSGLKDSEEKLLGTLRSLHNRLDRLLKMRDLQDVSGISKQDYIGTFGSWDKALESAGIDKEEYLIDDLRQVAAKVGGKPEKAACSRVGEYSYRTQKKYFGSWDAALEAAGLSSIDPAAGKEKETAEEPSGTATLTPSAPSEKSEGSVTLDPTTPIDQIEHRVDGVGRSSIHAVKKAGYTTLGELRDAEPREISKYKGIGRTRALKLIRFVTENLSSNGSSTGLSSNHRPSTDRPSSSTSGESSNRIQPSALDTSWETIPANERIDGQFLLQVIGVDQRVGDQKTARLDVRDHKGREFGMVIWSKHGVDQEWREGGWYALENAIGKVWESGDGLTRKKLSSTNDLKVIELGEDFDPNAESAGEKLETASEPQQAGATTDSNTDSETTTGDSGTDYGDVLNDMMKDFKLEDSE